MRFYFCESYINTDVDEKEVESDIYAAILYFLGFSGQDGYEKWQNHLEYFIRYFSLTPEQKCHYTLLKLAGKAYLW